jgi:diguanylate cyclase (GGDEF)-like protein
MFLQATLRPRRRELSGGPEELVPRSNTEGRTTGWLWLTGASLLVLYVVWSSRGWGGDRLWDALDNVIELLTAAAAAVMCAITARHHSGSRRLGWWALSVGLAGWSMGQLLTCYDVLLRNREVAFPGPADLGFLLLPLAAMLTLLMVPYGDRDQSRTRFVFDGLIIASSLVVLSLQTSLGDLVATRGQGLWMGLSWAYPVSDIALATVALLLLSRQSRPGRGVLGPLAISMLALSVSDGAYSYLAASDASSQWAWLAAGWPAAFCLIMVAARRSRREALLPVSEQELLPRELGPHWMGMALPYGPAIVVFLFMLSKVITGAPPTQPTRLVCTGIALLLLFRQLVALRENQALLRTVGHALRRLEHQTTHDALTGLPNRGHLVPCIEAELQRRRSYGGCAVLLLNLDRFRQVNATLGHCYGDQLLIHVAETLTAALPPEATLARVDGDQFALLLPGVDVAAATRTVERLGQALQNPCLLEGVSFAVEATIGIAMASDHSSAEQMLQSADIAMYGARRAQQPFRFYRAGDNTTTPARLSLLADLRTALSRTDELVLHYQPKVSVENETLYGVEALLRWRHPERGFIPPGDFIQSAEESGIISPLTRRVLQLALDQQRAWLASGWEVPVAVNVSARCLQDRAFPAMVEQLLAERGLPARLLTLELTESTIMIDTVYARNALYRLRRAGVTLSIDDFGTGYSSLAYLKNLPVTELKIDRSFITNLGEHTDDAIVRSVIDLGHNLGLTVVAEGIETEAALEKLYHLGCDLAQGFFISRPLPADEFNLWLQQHQDLPIRQASMKDFGLRPDAGPTRTEPRPL